MIGDVFLLWLCGSLAAIVGCAMLPGDWLVWFGILIMVGGFAEAGYYGLADPDDIASTASMAGTSNLIANPPTIGSSSITPLALFVASMVMGGGWIAVGMHNKSIAERSAEEVRGVEEQEEALVARVKQGSYEDVPTNGKNQDYLELEDPFRKRRKNGKKKKKPQLELAPLSKSLEADDHSEVTAVTLEMGLEEGENLFALKGSPITSW